MSYDIWLEVDLGAEEPVRVGDLDWNYTSNCAAMWRIAMPETDGLAGLAGMKARDAAAHLSRGIDRMKMEPAPYRALNPENGWGSYDSQLDALGQLLAAFEAAPGATVAIWQ